MARPELRQLGTIVAWQRLLGAIDQRRRDVEKGMITLIGDGSFNVLSMDSIFGLGEKLQQEGNHRLGEAQYRFGI